MRHLRPSDLAPGNEKKREEWEEAWLVWGQKNSAEDKAFALLAANTDSAPSITCCPLRAESDVTPE